MRTIPETAEQQIQQITERLRCIIINFAGNSDTSAIIRGYSSISANGLLDLLESSLHAQRDELIRLKKTAKSLTKRVDNLSQQQLL